MPIPFGAAFFARSRQVSGEQELAIAQSVEQRVAGRSLRALSDTKGGRDRLRHQIGHQERRQIDQPHAVREVVHEAACQPYRQPRFSNPARTG